MKYFGGCDVGSTYTKAVILDENGKMVADTTIRSKINSEQSAIAAMEEVLAKVGLSSSKELEYLIGTGYGRNKVPFADENISEISCHAMGVHVTNPEVKAIIDIGGQDVKGISIDTDGTVKNFAMNDKCAAGTGRFFEAMARSFELSLPEFSKLSLTAKNVIPITAQCTVFAESEVITLVGEGKPTDEIAAGIEMAVAKRCFVMAKKAGATDSITEGSHRACSEAEGRQPEDRPPADGCSGCCRVRPPEGPGQEVRSLIPKRLRHFVGAFFHARCCAQYSLLSAQGAGDGGLRHSSSPLTPAPYRLRQGRIHALTAGPGRRNIPVNRANCRKT